MHLVKKSVEIGVRVILDLETLFNRNHLPEDGVAGLVERGG